MLTVSKLERTEQERIKLKKEFYKRVYDDLSKKVTNASNFKRKNIILTIPAFYFGYPRYDVVKTTAYMKRQFEKGGFTCMLFDTNRLYVSWEKEKDQKKRDPIQETVERVEVPPELNHIPDFINLKKLANKYRHK